MDFNTNIYRVYFRKLLRWLVPGILDRPIQTAWLNSLVAPLKSLYTAFLSFRESMLYFLSITPQVCRLQKLLNDRYDNQQRRIRIVDGVEYLPLWLYTKAEAKPVALHRKSEGKPQWLYTRAECGATAVDFIIQVPVFVVFDLNEMIGLVRRFKLPSKTFKVQIV